MTSSGRTLVLGASGFVGRELRARLGAVGTATHAREDLLALDATRPSELSSILRATEAELVVNCIGLADVDRAEREPALAESLNHAVVSSLVSLQREIGFLFVHISTDYVFDGTQGMYRESDPTTPVNEYGRSKLRGEIAASTLDDALVLRISSPFGAGYGDRRTQFFRHVAQSLGEAKPVLALTDQRVTATYLPDLARAIETLVRRGARGLVHVGSLEPMSRFEFAHRVAETMGADSQLVHPCVREEMRGWTAPRPADTTLDVRLSPD